MVQIVRVKCKECNHRFTHVKVDEAMITCPICQSDTLIEQVFHEIKV